MDFYLGQILLLPYNFVPRGFALCNGATLQIRQLPALFALLGTRYGGDGRTTFGLPNLQGIVSYGASLSGSPPLGSATGSSTVTLDQTGTPSHTHGLGATTTTGTLATANNTVFAQTAVVSKGGTATGTRRYSTNAPNTAFAQQTVGAAGGGQPHNNMQPYIAINYYICTSGIYPSRP